MAVAMLSAQMKGSFERWEELAGVPDCVQATIDANASLEMSPSFRDMKHLVVIGRGYNYSTAFEIALKLKETNYLVAESYSAPDLLHGPVAMIGTGFPVVLVAPRGKAQADTPEILAIARQRNARLIAISDDDDILARADIALRLPTMPEWLSPMASVVAGQLLAGALARLNGLNPDRPRGLSKITLTR
jgi:glucosamine--fructose-6-phosphate aminotransferase (isomerizing)